MPRPRTIAALLALSALLFAGWTGATHWHFSSGHFSSGHFSSGHFSKGNLLSEGSKGSCCAHSELALSREDCGQEESHPGSVPESATPHCELCDFLAGNVFALQLNVEIAGPATVVELLSELSVMVPTRESRVASCRGPPLLV
jgi:hypothetical protein